MCGFTGILNYRSESIIDELRVKSMTDAIINRGPDDYGIFCKDNIGLGFRRLSILDLSNLGHQPISSPDQRYTMVFNGEIYNFYEFYAELKTKGYQFKSKSDSEVLLYLYMEYGESVLDKLNGMFAFCIWDSIEKNLFIARDRNGVKPLYYCATENEFIFGSEPKSLFAAGVAKGINEKQIFEWLLFRYIAGEATIYKNIKKLLPGHYIKIKEGQIKIFKWYNLAERILNHKSILNPNEWFIETFNSALKYRMVSDVPVGLLLSGGLDSSSVAASLKNLKFEGLNTFNVGFGNFELDESKIAGRLSKDLGFEYHSKQFMGYNLREAIKESTIALDEPIMHGNEPQIFAISKYANQFVKVLISGEGADEILSGYVRYKPLKNPFLTNSIGSILRILPDSLKNKRLRKLQNYTAISNNNLRVIFNGCNYFPNEFEKLFYPNSLNFNLDYRQAILNEAIKLYPNNPARQVLYLDQHTYLQSLNDRNDRTTMRASIECREPFQDFRLAEGLGSISNKAFYGNGKSKYILRNSMRNILPDYILNFKKVGFVAPIQQYIMEDEIMRQSFLSLRESKIFELPVFSDISKILLFDTPEYYPIRQQLWFFHLWFKHYNNEEIF
jgi:asparagine synthase (glutamine-hydrolysing)